MLSKSFAVGACALAFRARGVLVTESVSSDQEAFASWAFVETLADDFGKAAANFGSFLADGYGEGFIDLPYSERLSALRDSLVDASHNMESDDPEAAMLTRKHADEGDPEVLDFYIMPNEDVDADGHKAKALSQMKLGGEESMQTGAEEEQPRIITSGMPNEADDSPTTIIMQMPKEEMAQPQITEIPSMANENADEEPTIASKTMPSDDSKSNEDVKETAQKRLADKMLKKYQSLKVDVEAAAAKKKEAVQRKPPSRMMRASAGSDILKKIFGGRFAAPRSISRRNGIREDTAEPASSAVSNALAMEQEKNKRLTAELKALKAKGNMVAHEREEESPPQRRIFNFGGTPQRHTFNFGGVDHKKAGSSLGAALKAMMTAMGGHRRGGDASMNGVFGMMPMMSRGGDASMNGGFRMAPMMMPPRIPSPMAEIPTEDGHNSQNSLTISQSSSMGSDGNEFSRRTECRNGICRTLVSRKKDGEANPAAQLEMPVERPSMPGMPGMPSIMRFDLDAGDADSGAALPAGGYARKHDANEILKRIFGMPSENDHSIMMEELWDKI